MEAAAAFLSVRPRSVAETRRRLKHLGYPAALVETVVVRLAELGYLDDAAFARAWLESRDRSRPRGEAALRRELALKGVDPAIVAAVIEERRRSTSEQPLHRPRPVDAHDATDVGSADDGPSAASRSADFEAARRLLERRSPALMREPDERKRRQKAYALLARNGFDPETCREAAGRWADSGDDAVVL